MYKFAERNIDISTDSNLSKLKKLFGEGIKDMHGNKVKVDFDAIKDLELLDNDDLKYISDGDFALIHIDKDNNITRRFPMATLGDTVVSAIYFLKNHDSMPVQAQIIAANNLKNRLETACEVGQIPTCERSVRELEWALSDYARMSGYKPKKTNKYYESEDPENKLTMEQQVRQAISLEKEARAKLKDDDFVFVNGNNRLFPINTVQNIEKAASYFNENEKGFSLYHRHLFAKRLRDKTASVGAKIKADRLSKYASSLWSPTAEDCVWHRINMLNSINPIRNEKTGEYEVRTVNNSVQDKVLIGYRKLASLVGKMDIDQFAETLYQFDKAAGLDQRYAYGLRDAFESTYAQVPFFRPTVKKASKKVAFGKITFGGKTIDANKIFNLDIGDLGGMIDNDTFEELKCDPVNVFNSLPIPYKSVIMDAISGM